MSLRINHNIAAQAGHRYLAKNDANVSKSLERLSSGIRINRAADDAAGLIISEQMRAQITGTEQAIRNGETAISMMQTAEGALDEVSSLLNKARQLTLHAANAGTNDQNQLVADQTELDNIVDSVGRIADNTQFANKKLLDGSVSSFRSANNDIVGATQIGNHYQTGITTGSIVKGYHSVQVTQQASQGGLLLSSAATAGLFSAAAVAFSAVDGGDTFLKSFTFSVNGRNVSINSGQTKNDFLGALNAVGKSAGFTAVYTSGTAADAAAATNGIQGVMSGGSASGLANIALVNNSYGASSSISFAFVSGFTGASDFVGTSINGKDMQATLYLNTGSIGAVANSGGLQTVALTQSGNSLSLVSSTAGQGYRIDLKTALSISGGNTTGGMYYGLIDGTTSGATFQIGANAGQTASVELASTKASDLGTGVSGQYRSLQDLRGSSLSSGNANEAMKVVDKAIDQITTIRGKLGAFQASTLESSVSSLNVADQNLTSAESSIRDVDFAAESANFTKNNIMVQSATAMLAQANQLPQNVLKLLNG